MDDPRAAISLLLIVGGILLRADALIMIYLKGRKLKGAMPVLLAMVAPVVPTDHGNVRNGF